ncbi:MAG: hypothetical protein M3N19_00645 [Candidatus Eremiobacteraeota bacterium]|nr:hypothetical protein [Candidatus Eremiobacteraeota bacterium]
MKRNALPKLLSRVFAGTAAAVAAALFFGGAPGSALPAPSVSPGGQHTAEPTPEPLPSGTSVLSLGSSLLFILDDRISSKFSREGDTVRAHLKDALVVGSSTVAPAGTPVAIKIVAVHGAKAPDQDGTIDINFQPINLAGQMALPLYAPTAHLTVRVTSGQQSTSGITDEIKDIFIPYHYLYRMFRKGSDVVLDPGTILRARTAATVDASKSGLVSVVAPPPITLNPDAPHAAFKVLPMATLPPKKTPTPKPTPSPTPVPDDTVAPGATPTP